MGNKESSDKGSRKVTKLHSTTDTGPIVLDNAPNRQKRVLSVDDPGRANTQSQKPPQQQQQQPPAQPPQPQVVQPQVIQPVQQPPQQQAQQQAPKGKGMQQSRGGVGRAGGDDEPITFGPVQIEPGEIQLVKEIASGCFGTVHQGICRTKPVAVKVPKKQKLDKKEQECVQREVEIMSQIFHPNVCLFMGVCMVPGSIQIVTELLSGTVEALLKEKEKHINLSDRLKWVYDSAQGVAWLHGYNPPLIHRDLKPSNLLFDETGRIKVADFGLTEFREQIEQDRFVGTPRYMAPEVMKCLPITEKADVYSLGIILWEVITRTRPYNNYRDFKALQHAVCEAHERPPIPPETLPRLTELLHECWRDNPDERPTCANIVKQLEIIIEEQHKKEREAVILENVSDVNGAQLWKNRFLDKDSVTFQQLVTAFYEWLGIRLPDLNYTPAQVGQAELSNLSYVVVSHKMDDATRILQILKYLLVTDGKIDGLVTIQHWGRFLSWFGPLEEKYVENGILHRVIGVAGNLWFHGLIPDTKEAENKLKIQQPGSFLVRFSNNRPGCYCISTKKEDGQVQHIVIPYKPGKGFELRQPDTTTVYANLQELIEANQTQLGLTQPCGGSVFNSLF